MPYSDDFYVKRKDAKVHAAHAIVEYFLELAGPVASVVDVGCGIGTWLNSWHEKGVSRLQGFDGPWVKDSDLVMPRAWFERRDLGEPLNLEQRFDVATSLEVAEHLPSSKAELFVENLTKAADLVLFSAAVPGQGGTHHVNEQWPGYWKELFAARGYELCDVMRGKFWTDEKIPYWYRQNLFVYATPEALQKRPALQEAANRSAGAPLSVVHPAMFTHKLPFWKAQDKRAWPPNS